MKRILILALLLTGCGPSPSVTRGTSEDLVVFNDRDTGCQYVRGGYGLTPRIAADGRTHMGCKAVAP